jgi:hypothetical protein
VSGSGPPRLPVSSPSMATTSLVVSSKSNTSKFSAMRRCLVDFGMTERPYCRCSALLIKLSKAKLPMYSISSDSVYARVETRSPNS